MTLFNFFDYKICLKNNSKEKDTSNVISVYESREQGFLIYFFDYKKCLKIIEMRKCFERHFSLRVQRGFFKFLSLQNMLENNSNEKNTSNVISVDESLEGRTKRTAMQ